MGPPAAPGSPGGSYADLLLDRRYGRFVAAELVMRLGHGLFAAALPWWMMEAWGSDRCAGWATVALYLPYLVLSLPAGAAVDRVGRRRLMVAVSLGGAAVAGAVPLLHGAELLERWLAFVLAVLLSSTSLALHLARSSLLPQLVSEIALTRANAISSIVIGMSLAAGNALIGPVTTVVGLSGSFYVPAATLLFSAVLLAAVSPCPDAGVNRHLGGPGLSDLGEGLRYAWSDRVVRQLFALDTLYFVLASGLFATGLPLFVKNSLSGGPAVYGYIGMAGSLGMLVGALFISRLDAVMRRTRLITVAWLCYGAALLGHPLLQSVSGSLGAHFVAGLTGNWIPVSESALLQQRVPGSLRGRVFGVRAIIAPGATVLSGLIAGALVGAVSPAALTAAGASLTCSNALLARLGPLWQQGEV